MTFLDILWKYSRDEAFIVPDRAKKAMLAARNRILSDADRIAQLEKDNADLRHDNERYVGIANSLANECEELREGRAQPEAGDEALLERLARALCDAEDVGWPSGTFAAEQARYYGMAEVAIRVLRGDQ